MKNGAYDKDNKPVYVKTYTTDSISNSTEAEIVMARAMHNIHVSARRIAVALEKIANQPKPEPIDLNGLANFVVKLPLTVTMKGPTA